MTAPALFTTSRFGEVEPTSETEITVPEGLLGFPGYTRFMILPHPGGLVFWLQSLEDGTLAFPVMDPRAAVPAYAPDLNDEDRRILQLAKNIAPVFLTILSIRSEGVTTNLQGPLAVNPATRKARQLLLPPELYPLRHPVILRAAVDTTGK
jgi:flagellar assembly factor FliW